MNPFEVNSFEREMYIYMQSYNQLMTIIQNHTNFSTRPLIIIERGLEPAHHIFTKMDLKLGYINDFQYKLLNNLYTTYIVSIPENYHLTIWLKSSLETSEWGVNNRLQQNDKCLRDKFVEQIWTAYETYRLPKDHHNNFIIVDRDQYNDSNQLKTIVVDKIQQFLEDVNTIEFSLPFLNF